MDVETYVGQAEQAMRADGCTITWVEVSARRALVGYRAVFHKPTLTRLHVFNVLTAFDPAAGEMAAFAKDVSRFAKSQSGEFRGAQSGVMAFAVACAENPSRSAIDEAQAKPRLEFAVRVQPGLVDLASGGIHTYQGRMVWGAAYNGLLRRTFKAQIPTPV